MLTCQSLRYCFGLTTIVLLHAACTPSQPAQRCAGWIDVYEGEPIAYEDVIDDLKDARVIYLGERHTLERHHVLQERIVRDLAARGAPLVLGMEMMEAAYQPALDEYSQGGITFEQLAEKTDWARQWSNYEQYRGVIEAAKQTGAPLVALNAKAQTVRAVAMKGIDGLDEAERRELPAEINLDDPMYEQEMNRVMRVHASKMAEHMRRMFEAQVCRDETMADRLCAFLASPRGRGRTAVVLCGAGHVSQGMGIPSRVRRRMLDVRDRIIVMSESGDVELSPKMQAMVREIVTTHEDLRHLDKPIADYLHVTSLKP